MTAIPRSRRMTVERPRRMTVEEAYFAKLRAAGAAPPQLGGAEAGGALPPPRAAEAGGALPQPRHAESGGALRPPTSAATRGTARPAEPVIIGSAQGTAGEAVGGSEPSITPADAPRDAPARREPTHRSGSSTPPVARRAPRPETWPPARPRIEPDPAILGLSRHTRSRLGSRLFNWFFALVFVLIVIQMIVALLLP